MLDSKLVCRKKDILIYYANSKQKTAGVVILTSDNMDFKTKITTRNKE